MILRAARQDPRDDVPPRPRGAGAPTEEARRTMLDFRALHEHSVRRAPYVPPEYEVVEVPPVVRLVGPTPHFLDNGVTWSRLDEDDADAVIAREVAFFEARGSDLQWNVYDGDGPDDLGERLERAGFAHGTDETLMGAAAAPSAQTSPASPWTIRPVVTPADLEVYLAIGTEVWGPDLEAWHRDVHGKQLVPDHPTTLYVAYDGAKGVACGNVVVPPGGPVAHLFGSTVLPSHRRRGIYRALLAARAARAAERGATAVITDANENSRPVLERVGFVPFGRRTEYVRRRN